MGRFALREFSTPQYAGYIPQETDPEGRPVQQLEKFATFLNEIPWFSKGEDSQSEQSSADGLLHPTPGSFLRVGWQFGQRSSRNSGPL